MEVQEDGKKVDLTKFHFKTQPEKHKHSKKFCHPRLFLFSREQKIVSAVWYHEREYSGLSKQDILNNFTIRFKVTPPSIETISRWERKLFTRGLTQGRLRNSLWRLIHVPYVRESLKRNPDISNRARATLLGITPGTLKCIMEQDLKDYPPDFDEEKIDAFECNETREEKQGE